MAVTYTDEESSSSPIFDLQPLYLSTIAGLSTCLGAAVVFCQPKDEHSNNKNVSPHTMAFSLALAGSVMVTVVVVSILPEVLMEDDKENNSYDKDGNDYMSYKMINIFSMSMFYRIFFFGLGSALYFGLSSIFNVPEPEEMLDIVLLGDNQHLLSSQSCEDVENSNNNHNEMSNKSDMVELLSSSPSTINDDLKENSPLRERKGQTYIKPLSNYCKESPGDNNGKIKSISPNSNHNNNITTTTHEKVHTSMREWTTGNDLSTVEQKKAWRVAVLLFVSLLVHNFPEGLAVAASALESTKLGTLRYCYKIPMKYFYCSMGTSNNYRLMVGVTVTVGIMIHNIPEGIAIAIPCLAARPDKPWLSFILASVSGLAEPMGAFVALLFLRSGMKGNILNLENILSFVAGIMVMVALWELFPEAQRHVIQTKRYFWLGTYVGIAIMIMTELYLP